MTKFKNLLVALALLATAQIQLFGQGTTFTYQGRLNTNGTPANGLYDFEFSLSNAPSGGVQVGSTITQTAIGVTNGLFITTLNFGAVFTGNATWLAIGVRSNNVGNYTLMPPLQELNPTPYAIFANTASNVIGPVPATQLTGDVPNASLGGTYGGVVTLSNAGNSFTGNGVGLTGVNAQLLDGLNASSFWQLTGNSGTTPGINFVGTSDNQPVEFHVNGGRAFRLEPGGPSTLSGTNTPTGAPNVIGGSQLNSVASGVVGSVIGGGGATNFNGAKFTNSIALDSDFSVIGGGILNVVQTYSYLSTVSGGENNIIQAAAQCSVIGGGDENLIQTNSWGSTISGGSYNSIETNCWGSTIGGGYVNTIQTNSVLCTIGGGYVIFIGTNSSFSTICGGSNNAIMDNAPSSFISGGANNSIYSNSFYSTIGGGDTGSIGSYSDHSTISGGSSNYMFDYCSNSYIGGGYLNGVGSSYATVAGGDFNYAAGEWGTVGGGYGNETFAPYATVPGGYGNYASGTYSFAAGNQADAVNQGAFVWGDSQNAAFSSTANDQFLVRAQGGVGIGTNSPSAALHVSTGGNALNPQLRVDQMTKGDYARLRMVNEGGSGATWDVAVGGSPNVMNFFASPTAGGTGTNILILQPNGNATLWGTLAMGSDRAHKDHIKAIDPRKVLAKVAGMPISEWDYKTEPGVPHLGPMAQDFYAAFNLGQDNKHITTVDEGGVALAAIQGLNQKLEAETKAKDGEIEALKQSVEELKKLVQSLAEKE